MRLSMALAAPLLLAALPAHAALSAQERAISQSVDAGVDARLS